MSWEVGAGSSELSAGNCRLEDGSWELGAESWSWELSGDARSYLGAVMNCQALLWLLLMRNRCSSDYHFHVEASEAKRSEAVLIQLVLHALILLHTFLHAFQFLNT